MRKQVETLIHRIELVASAEERSAVLHDLELCGYSVIRIGPYTNEKIFPKVDVSRFKLIAERRADEVIEAGDNLEASLFGFSELYGDPPAKEAIRAWRSLQSKFQHHAG
jgi:hypothetical protein